MTSKEPNKLILTIGYLYPDLMNIYGDTGNITTLQKRCQWRGIKVQIKHITIGNNVTPRECDMYFFGGGQDQAQGEVAKDLVRSDKGNVIRDEVEREVPLLAICGGYQLLGEYYQPFDAPKLPGVGIFPAFTKASNERMIGNILVQISDVRFQMSDKLIIGFENHSGKTYLKEGVQPLGKVKTGFGNNGEDGTEGCIYKNAIGCYMHGSLLPKNPQLADYLIQKALETKYGRSITLKPLNDSLETLAHNSAIQKKLN